MFGRQPLVSRKLLFKLQPQKRKKQTQRNLSEGFKAACNHFESSLDFSIWLFYYFGQSYSWMF